MPASSNSCSRAPISPCLLADTLRISWKASGFLASNCPSRVLKTWGTCSGTSTGSSKRTWKDRSVLLWPGLVAAPHTPGISACGFHMPAHKPATDVDPTPPKNRAWDCRTRKLVFSTPWRFAGQTHSLHNVDSHPIRTFIGFNMQQPDTRVLLNNHPPCAFLKDSRS